MNAEPKLPSCQENSLFLVLPGLLFVDETGALYFERQACNGLARWADNFDRLTVACPASPLFSVRDDPSIVCDPISSIESIDRITFLPLPSQWRLLGFLAAWPRVVRTLGAAIDAHRYLSFAIGGLVGDWGAVACYVAARRQRRYSVWTDRVEHRVVRSETFSSEASSLKRQARRLKARCTAWAMAWLEAYVIRRAALGLFHGADCFKAYSPFCRNAFIVHDIHLKATDIIPAPMLSAKLDRLLGTDTPVDLIYAGRAVSMKGVLDWVDTMAALRDQGLSFRATWFGQGEEWGLARDRLRQLGLQAHVEFPGVLNDRQALFERLRSADLLVFCHLTPESPRILIEALMSALPIVGYGSPYPEDLLGDPELSTQLLTAHDPRQLAARLAALMRDRPRLAAVIQRCAEIGTHFSDAAVFRHRSDLIKAYL